VEVGAWTLADDLLQLILHSHQAARKILYGFVSGDDVLYIGVSTRSLEQRMRGYARPGPTQRTSRANHARLVTLLGEGLAVTFWVLVPDELITYRSISLDVPAGLESTLINRLRPPWNIRGR
jgi:hypothetical protein